MSINHVLRHMLIGVLLCCASHSRGQLLVKTEQSLREETCRQCGLSDSDIFSLEKNRILITDQGYKQIFSAYSGINRWIPVFITSDSILNGYHVLYEESIFRLESAQAVRLPWILRLILHNMEDVDAGCEGKPELTAAAKRRAMLVTGIALRLLDDSFCFGDQGLDTILATETERIRKAEATGMPNWLGKPDATFVAIDYSRYKPRGFYTRTEQLERYFRAVSWLQSIPFRVEKDEELLAILMLGNCVTSSRFKDYKKEMEIRSFFQAYGEFIGAGDDWDIMTAAHNAQNELQLHLDGDSLQRKREWLMKEAEKHGEKSQINDQVRLAPRDQQAVAELNFRIISACRTPDAILFQRTAQLHPPAEPYPDGLEIAAALGSDYARKSLGDYHKEEILITIDACKPQFEGSSLYHEYLHALKALLDEPEPDAPDFMKNEAWQIKSCNTVLAGQAQLQHTWVLMSKTLTAYGGMMEIPPGFVEPEPEFFSRMADLANHTRYLLIQTGATAPNYIPLISALKTIGRRFDDIKDKDEFSHKYHEFPINDQLAMEISCIAMHTNLWDMKEITASFIEQLQNQADILAMAIENGDISNYPELEMTIEANNSEFDLNTLWQKFENLSRRLETIAHKQLRQVNLSKSDATFIEYYGEALAEIMLYAGSSSSFPRDDAPRIVDVFTNPNTGGYLHVGVARPRAIYVLYPWNDQTVVCRGAVLPYYEFVSDSRLTDASWKQILDSRKRPAIPNWARPIVQSGGLARPILSEDY